MSPLRQKMIDTLALLGRSPRTQESYLYAVTKLAAYYHRFGSGVYRCSRSRTLLFVSVERAEVSPCQCAYSSERGTVSVFASPEAPIGTLPDPLPQTASTHPRVAFPSGRAKVGGLLQQSQALHHALDLLRRRPQSQ